MLFKKIISCCLPLSLLLSTAPCMQAAQRRAPRQRIVLAASSKQDQYRMPAYEVLEKRAVSFDNFYTSFITRKHQSDGSFLSRLCHIAAGQSLTATDIDQTANNWSEPMLWKGASPEVREYYRIQAVKFLKAVAIQHK